jgi:hypothetical protein
VLTIPAAALGMAATAVESAMEAVAAGPEAPAIIAAEVVAADPIIAPDAIIASAAMTEEEDCAVAKPARAETSVALEKYIFAVMIRLIRLILGM